MGCYTEHWGVLMWQESSWKTSVWDWGSGILYTKRNTTNLPSGLCVCVCGSYYVTCCNRYTCWTLFTQSSCVLSLSFFSVLCEEKNGLRSDEATQEFSQTLRFLSYTVWQCLQHEYKWNVKNLLLNRGQNTVNLKSDISKVTFEKLVKVVIDWSY